MNKPVYSEGHLISLRAARRENILNEIIIELNHLIDAMIFNPAMVLDNAAALEHIEQSISFGANVSADLAAWESAASLVLERAAKALMEGEAYHLASRAYWHAAVRSKDAGRSEMLKAASDGADAMTETQPQS